jgi:hypothetical protein
MSRSAPACISSSAYQLPSRVNSLSLPLVQKSPVRSGRQQVHDQIQRVVTIMKLCEDMKDFKRKFDRVFKKTAIQMSFTEIWESPE